MGRDYTNGIVLGNDKERKREKWRARDREICPNCHLCPNCLVKLTPMPSFGTSMSKLPSQADPKWRNLEQSMQAKPLLDDGQDDDLWVVRKSSKPKAHEA